MAKAAEGIDLYIRHLKAKAAGQAEVARRLLRASADLGEPMALHAAAYEAAGEAAVALYAAAADAGFAPSAWNLYLHYDDLGDAAAARLWLARAAALGDEDAIRLIGAEHGRETQATGAAEG